MALAMTIVISPLASIYIATDGMMVLGIVVAATLLGMGCLEWLFRHTRLPWSWWIICGAGVGLGLLSTSMFILGVLGVLNRTAIIVCLMLFLAFGSWRIIRRIGRQTPTGNFHGYTSFKLQRGQIGSLGQWLWLLLAPALALSLLVASVPPGILWVEEGHGYDVLEYHLQVPKEYYNAGKIEYLPHNIYSNFPQGAGMLYLLVMVLKQDPIEACFMAKYINVAFAALFVAAIWLGGSLYHPRAALLGAVLGGSVPWLMYLCGVAFTELGMLFFGALAIACFLYAARSYLPDRRADSDLSGVWKFILLGGLFAGWSCGFKYTAVVMIAIPLSLVCLMIPGRSSWRRNWGHSAILLLGVMISFCPWLIRNWVWTGNPVFPLATSVFGYDDDVWTEELAHRWDEAHRPVKQEQSALRRLSYFQQRVLLDRRFGFWLLLMALPIAIGRERSREDLMLWLLFLWQALTWICFTHLYARFAVSMLIPLLLLAGRSILASHRVGYQRAFGFLLGLVVAWNTWTSWRIFSSELYHEGQPINVYASTEYFCGIDASDYIPAAYIRHQLEGTDRVLLVGEARAYYYPANVDYSVVFNRNPLEEIADTADDAEGVIRWLNEQGYTHLLVHWSEIKRLRHSYGFGSHLDHRFMVSLEEVGLAVKKDFGDTNGLPIATLYEIRRF